MIQHTVPLKDMVKWHEKQAKAPVLSFATSKDLCLKNAVVDGQYMLLVRLVRVYHCNNV